MIANLLMLTPTVYMLQLYDRVLKGRSELTLIVITLLMVFFYGIMVVAEWLRSRLLVRGGVRMDEAMNAIVFNASFEKNLKQAASNPSEAMGDLAAIRQFLTGNGIFAFFDTPWMPTYTGGYTSAAVRQAWARRLKAKEGLHFQERESLTRVRRYYQTQINSIAQVRAYEQAAESAEIALEGTKKGFQAGFRTSAEVLDAVKKLYDIRRSLARARYQDILNRLMLRDAAGLLSESDLDGIDEFFVLAGSYVLFVLLLTRHYCPFCRFISL